MRLIIAGSRTLWPTREQIDDALASAPWPVIDPDIMLYDAAMAFGVKTVISGCAVGVDRAGEAWARDRAIPIERFPVTALDWKTYGGIAGYRRNRRMANVADAALILWDGQSRGAKHMATVMVEFGKLAHIVTMAVPLPPRVTPTPRGL